MYLWYNLLFVSHGMTWFFGIPYSHALDKGLNYYMSKYELYLVDTPTSKTYCGNYRK